MIGITTDKDGNILISAQLSNSIRKYNISSGNFLLSFLSPLYLSPQILYQLSLTHSRILGQVTTIIGDTTLYRTSRMDGQGLSRLSVSSFFAFFFELLKKFVLNFVSIGIALEPESGDVYFIDAASSTLRKFNQDLQVTTLAGGHNDGNGDGVILIGFYNHIFTFSLFLRSPCLIIIGILLTGLQRGCTTLLMLNPELFMC